MSDAWQMLEERFRDLAEKTAELTINAFPDGSKYDWAPDDAERLVLTGWSETTAGWQSESGVWSWYVTGPKGKLYVEEMALLIQRADQLLNYDRKDHSLFLNVLISQFGKAAVGYDYKHPNVMFFTRPPFNFSPAAELCALTTGYLLNRPEVAEGIIAAFGQSDDQKQAAVKKRRGTVEERLVALYLEDHRKEGYSAEQLAVILDCSPRHIRRMKIYKAILADADHKRQTGGL